MMIFPGVNLCLVGFPMISRPKDGSLVHRQDMVGATTWSFVNLGAEKSLEIMSFVSQKPLGVWGWGTTYDGADDVVFFFPIFFDAQMGGAYLR